MPVNLRSSNELAARGGVTRSRTSRTLSRSNWQSALRPRARRCASGSRCGNRTFGRVAALCAVGL